MGGRKERFPDAVPGRPAGGADSATRDHREDDAGRSLSGWPGHRLWKDQGDLVNTVEPAIDEAKRDYLYAGWNKVVDRSRDWEKH
jgi:hypothetical protein